MADSPASRQDWRILVVEDDPLVSEIVAATLDDDYTTTVVETAAAALAQVRGGGIRLMLLDCTLPDGVDASLIKEADQAGIPIVFMSGDPARVRSLVDNPRPFILKPFSLTDLIATVDAALSGSSGAKGVAGRG